MSPEIQVEIVLRKKQVSHYPEHLKEILDPYKQHETDDRIIYDVPQDWPGFKDGTVIEIIKTFNEAVFIGLVYFTMDDRIIVTDFEGRPVERFEVVVDGRKTYRYVKKKLRIIDIVNSDSETFTVKQYLLDLKYYNSVISVLDLYSVGTSGGLRLCQFVNPGVDNER